MIESFFNKKKSFSLDLSTAPAPHSQSGQVIVEYVLLLVVAVAMATIIVTQVVQRNPDSPGFLIKKWTEIQKTIGDDDPGKN